MNQTLEEQVQAQEKQNKMDNQFYGEVSDVCKDNVCAVIGLIKNQIFVLEDELNDSKIRFANAARDPNLHWTVKYERDCECKVIEGKIAILHKFQRDFENMISPMPSQMPKSMAMAS